MGISPAVLCRWQPERSEVSLSLFVIMANRKPIYFIADSFSLLSWRIILLAQQIRKSHFGLFSCQRTELVFQFENNLTMSITNLLIIPHFCDKTSLTY